MTDKNKPLPFGALRRTPRITLPDRWSWEGTQDSEALALVAAHELYDRCVEHYRGQMRKQLLELHKAPGDFDSNYKLSIIADFLGIKLDTKKVEGSPYRRA